MNPPPEKGDKVLVPKGTIVYSEQHKNGVPSKKDVIVKVHHIRKGVVLFDEASRKEIRSDMVVWRGAGGLPKGKSARRVDVKYFPPNQSPV
jgi:hypothetical protein